MQDGRGSEPMTVETTLCNVLAPLCIKSANHTQTLVHEYGEHQMETTVLDTVRFELNCITTWLENLETAYQAEKKVQRLSEQMKMLENQKSVKFDVAKKDLENARCEATRYQRGLLTVELQRFKRSRVLRALRLRRCIAQMHVDGAEAILSVWTAAGPDQVEWDQDAATDPVMEPPAVVEEVVAPPPKPVEVIVVKSEPALLPPPPVVIETVMVKEPPVPTLTEDKIVQLAFSVASRAVEESRAKAAEDEAIRESLKPPMVIENVHKDCKSIQEVADMFWIFVYCVVAVHGFFALVFLSRGYFKESVPILVLAGLTILTGLLVELVHR